jgi:ABC-type transport system substrate-binding protein
VGRGHHLGGREDVVTPLVLSGDLYYSTNAYPAAVVEQFQAQGLTVIQGLLGFGSALYVQHDKAPLNILEVRKALAHAIDREEVAQAVVTAKAPKYLVGFPEHLYGPWLTDETIARLDPYEHDPNKADATCSRPGIR